MSFLVPAAFWFLLILLPLLWLWRFTETRRTILIPSLRPFQRLREQQPTAQWVRLNLLLLLQILLLLALIGALAQPRLHGKWFDRPHQTVIAILDNSGSMRAASGGATAFVRARAEVLREADDLEANDRLAVVTTAPPQLVTSPGANDPSPVRAAVNNVAVTDAPGDVAGAIQLAQSLAGEHGINRLLVLTDEPPPAGALPRAVEWRQVGRPLPNVALTQFELSHALAENVPLTATVEVANFAEESQDVDITLSSGATHLAAQTVRLAPREHRTVALGPLTVPVAESITATIHAPHDALTADNTSIISRHGPDKIELALDGLPAEVQRVFERLARSTPTLGLAQDASHGVPPVRVIYAAPTSEPRAPTLYVWPTDGRKKLRAIRVVDWDTAHPVTRFLSSADQLPLTAVRLPASPASEAQQAGDVAWPAWAHPVVWGSDGARSVPLVGVGQRAGFREVVTTLGLEAVNFDDPRAVELLILLLNITNWLAPSSQALRVATGTPFTAPFLPAGDVTVTLPTGETQHLAHPGGAWEFPETWWAGSYRVTSHGDHWQFHAALMDERESNLLKAAAAVPDGIWPSAAPATAAQASPRPIARWLWWLAAFVFLAEWWLYQRRVIARSAA